MIPFDHQNMQAMIKENVACFPFEAANNFEKYFHRIEVGKQALIEIKPPKQVVETMPFNTEI